MSESFSFWAALCSGGVAGFAVDVSLYPLDTIKTRLQSPQGFLKSGGFRGIYKGLGVAALGSAPGAALFFSSYETCKHIFHDSRPATPAALIHMGAASCSEVAACLVRVPTEVMKQRYQANQLKSGTSLAGNISELINKEGISGFYRGFGSTILREIPFSLIQFPLYEALKKTLSRNVFGGRDLLPYEGALCGSFSGGVAAALTTPLDVIKTRLMLGKDLAGVPYNGVIDTFTRLLKEGEATAITQSSPSISVISSQIRLLFSGVQPRVMWISIGGFVFFGAYEQAVRILKPIFVPLH